MRLYCTAIPALGTHSHASLSVEPCNTPQQSSSVDRPTGSTSPPVTHVRWRHCAKCLCQESASEVTCASAPVPAQVAQPFDCGGGGVPAAVSDALAAGGYAAAVAGGDASMLLPSLHSTEVLHGACAPQGLWGGGRACQQAASHACSCLGLAGVATTAALGSSSQLLHHVVLQGCIMQPLTCQGLCMRAHR